MENEPRPKPVILLAEDDALLRLCASEMLEEHGFAVIEAENGDKALALLQAGLTVNALVTDIEMPGSLNGLELARRAKRDFPDLVVVVVSGRVTPAGQELPPGAHFYGKPIDDAQVVGALRESLDIV